MSSPAPEPASENVQARVVISGRVQGVGYRASAHRQASQLGLDGWVRNLEDGSVEAVLEGPRAAVEEMIRWCRKGPSFARVADVETEWRPAAGEFSGFGIRD